MSGRRSPPVQFLYETTLFVVVSVFDILMTHRLIRTGRFHESNPVARFFYDHWGINGMVYFKMAMVGFLVVLTQLIAHRRPDRAQGVLRLAIAVVALVVIYSLVLLLRSRHII
tara:strand:+ start:148 stop:486 length:339 start_codon:yes stop_codon:yes gene_type:complete